MPAGTRIDWINYGCRSERTLHSGVTDTKCGAPPAVSLALSGDQATVRGAQPLERWVLLTNGHGQHWSSTISTPGVISFTLPAHTESKRYTLRACRVCVGCGRDGANQSALVSSKWRNKSSVDECTHAGLCTTAEHVTVPAASRVKRPCCSSLVGSSGLTSGGWSRDGAAFEHHACVMPSLSHLQRGLRAARAAVLFVGDSTLEEQALLFAHAAGYAFAELQTEPACEQGGSLWRHWNATGRGMRLAMRWGAASDCAKNLEGWPLSSAWQTALVGFANEFKPGVVVFSPPVQHLQSACVQHRDRVRRKVRFIRGSAAERLKCGLDELRAAIRGHLRFMIERVAAPVGATLVLASTGHYAVRNLCNAELAQLHAFAADALAELAPTATPRPVLVDVFSQATSWQDHVSTEIRPNITCAQHWSHCTCHSKLRAFDGATVLPPCSAAHRVILMAVLRLVGGEGLCSHNIRHNANPALLASVR